MIKRYLSKPLLTSALSLICFFSIAQTPYCVEGATGISNAVSGGIPSFNASDLW